MSGAGKRPTQVIASPAPDKAGAGLAMTCVYPEGEIAPS
jgi:hypothetical protein